MRKNNHRVIIVTGASSGIGRALCDFFSSKGNTVIGLSRSAPKLPYSFKHYPLDISDEAAVSKTVSTIVEQYKSIDVLINCAGIGLGGPLELTSKEQGAKMLDVNVLGAFLMSKHCLPFLRESKGYVFNIGSVAGPLTIPFQTFYSMSKAAVQAFSEGLRMEVKPFGIRVSCVLPGDTKTDFTARREKIAPEPLYGPRLTRSVEKMEHDEINGKSPDTISRVINKLITKKRVPPVVTVGFSYKLLLFLNRLLPRRLVLAILYSMYGK